MDCHASLAETNFLISPPHRFEHFLQPYSACFFKKFIMAALKTASCSMFAM